MASKLIAALALIASSFCIMLGNFWFTYGVWPRSWTAFVFFAVAQMVNYLLLQAIGKEIKES